MRVCVSGWGAQKPGEDLAEHVLGPFDAEEARQLPAVLERAALAVESVICDGVAVAITRVNGAGALDPPGPLDRDSDVSNGRDS